MATYTKTVWSTGDLITAEKMNKVETQLETVTPGATGAVRSDTSQSLNDTEKATARTNIAAASTADITTLTNNLNSTETSIAPAFSTSTAYAVGDLVIYNNKLYRFTIAHAAGAWNTDQVEEVNVSDILENKADINGYYEGMGVGTADQLAATQYVEDNEPYVFRTSGGTADIGASVEEMLVGGTIAWNQTFRPSSFNATCSGITMSISDQTISAAGTCTENSMKGVSVANVSTYAVPANHIVLLTHTGSSGIVDFGRRGFSETTTNNYFFHKYNLDFDAIPRFDFYSNQTYNFAVKVAVYDLTQMFGTTIADYIYSLEQTTAGAGVAWFKKLFPKPYYEYNAGELISVAAAKKEAVGFNAWDEEYQTGYWTANGSFMANSSGYMSSKNAIPVFPDTEYAFRVGEPITGIGKTVYVLYLDANKNAIERATRGIATGSNYLTFTTSSNCHYIQFSTESFYGTTYNNDICINLSWSGYRDGEYESYKKSTTEFDPNLELHGIVKLDANNNLYYDGDTYESDGTVTRKYKQITFSSNSYNLHKNDGTDGNDNYLYYFEIPDVSTVSGMETYLVSSRFCTGAERASQLTGGMMVFSGAYKVLYINTQGLVSTNTIAAVTQWLDANEVKFVYPLATPITETVTPFTKTQWVDDFGTEQFYDSKVLAGSRDVSMPVGHESKYLANLRDKLQHLPELAEEDGDYYIRQKNEQMELVNFADGYNHPYGVVGTAQQLESTIYEEDKVPYAYRTSGGSADIGNRVDEEIVGGTICWNQISYPIASTNGEMTLSISENKVIANLATGGNASSYNSVYARINNSTSVTVSGHKYLVAINGLKETNGVFRYYIGGTWVNGSSTFSYILSSNRPGIIVASGYTGGTLTIMVDGRDSQLVSQTSYPVTAEFYPQIFDLTQMFGSTIADYVYSLETATAGAGVAWFKSLFPKDYYAYNPGELMSVNAARKETVGFNLWDEDVKSGRWAQDVGSTCTAVADSTRFSNKNPIPVLPNTTYYFMSPSDYGTFIILLCDKNMTLLDIKNTNDNRTFTTSTNSAFICFYPLTSGKNQYNNDICINLSWSGTRNGEYEPYQKLNRELGDVELRGIPKLDANNKLYYDGDTYMSDGTVTRRYGIVDLGALTWTKMNWEGIVYYNSSIIADMKFWATSVVATDFISARYSPIEASTSAMGNYDKGIIHYQNYIAIRDISYSDAASLKASLNGVYCVYELATPTEETSTPYANPSPVDDWGTEEFIDRAVEAGERDVSVPVGHDSKYMANLRDKLQHLPDLAANNGTYVISQNNSSMTLVPLTTPTELPAAPSSNGTYKLRCVVSSGTATYSWVADS